MVHIIWFDSSQSANETIAGLGPIDPAYKDGAIAEVIGFLRDETDMCYVIGDTFESDGAVAPSQRRVRSIRNITKASVWRMTDIVLRGIHVEPERPAPPMPQGDRFRETTSEGTSSPSTDSGKAARTAGHAAGPED